MHRWLPSLLLIVATLAPTSLWAQRELKDIPDPDPELERQTFQVADGFEVNLYAADPRIAKPIQMNFDAQGRLWIASSEIYPQIQPGQKANDRILVVEDTNGDGTADKTSVFADGLLIPTGVEPGDGGAYVANSTELVHFRDLDGDGKADDKRVLLSGFGTEDTHHIIHTFRWGMDGTLYFNQSIYIHSHIETPWGVRRLGGGGIWQFRPETLQLEILCRGFVNTWGHHQDAWGQSFATDGAFGEGINFVFPGSVFITAPGATRIMKGLNPGSPKHCGLEVLSGTHLPEDWRGNMIANDFRGHRVCRFVITEDGSGYASREVSEVIKTEHVAFRPIDVKMGPDGAIYIADWYNPIIQHGEVDFRDPRRDHTHGRIWRVTAKGRPLVKRPQLAGNSVEGLLAALKSPEQFTRHHAKRMLKETGAEKVLPALEKWVERLDPNDSQFEHQRLEGLWVYQSLDVAEPKLLSAVLASRDHRARAAAIRVLSAWRERVPGVLDTLDRAAQDEHPRVRLEAVCALGTIPGIQSTELALAALDYPLDANLDFALWQLARDRQGDWLSAVQQGKTDFSGKSQRLIFALQSVGTPAVVQPLVQLLKSGKVAAGGQENVLKLIASLGGPAEMRLVYDLALAEAERPERLPLAVQLLGSLTEAAQRRKVIPEGDLSGLAKLFGRNPELNAAAARAAGFWKLEATRGLLEEMINSASGINPAVQAAIEGLVHLGGEASRATLAKLADKQRPQPIQLAAVGALAALDLPAASRLAVDALSQSSLTEDPSPLFTTLWQQKEGPAEFVKALGERKLPEDIAKLGVRLARVSGRDLPDLVTALNTAGGISGMVKELTPEQMQELLAAVRERGDAVRGERIFRRTDQVCLKCHAISGAGGLVGPDLASIGASAQPDYLVDSLLVPSKQIKENYHSLAVETKEGKIITGVKVRQTDADLVLRNAEDQEVAIPLGEIEEQANTGSIMPTGLTETLTRDELVDLVRFLSELGKVGPYAPSQARVARRWQALDPTTPGLNQLLSFEPAAVVNRPGLIWSPAYSRVSGNLPIDELPSVIYPIGNVKVSLVRTQIELTTGGKVKLLMKVPAGTSLWVAGKAIEPQPELTLDLASGSQPVLLRLNRGEPGQEVRLELTDVPGSPAQARFATGK